MPPWKEDAVMQEMLKWVISAKFGLIVILFLTPFVTVSCGGMVNIPFSGTDMAFGKTIELKEPFSGQIQTQEIDSEPRALIAFFCALGGLLAAFFAGRFARLSGVAFGVAGAVLLLMLRSEIEDQVLQEGSGMLAVHYEFAFYAVLVLFLAAALANAFALAEQKK